MAPPELPKATSPQVALGGARSAHPVEAPAIASTMPTIQARRNMPSPSLNYEMTADVLGMSRVRFFNSLALSRAPLEPEPACEYQA